MNEQSENKQKRQESVKLDEVMRLLFDMSKETLVKMLNGLFGETFNPELVDITKDNAKFVNEQLEIIEGDLFLRVFKPPYTKPLLFHLEFQTGEDDTMAIRVLRYDINKAVENQQLSRDKSEMILYMPQSLVIHIEPHKSIPDEYKAVIVFADGDIKRFSVPVMKYWTFTDEELISKNLFPLLPLRIYLLRETLDTLTKSGDEQAKQAAVIKARDIAETAAREAAGLNKAGLLTGEDYKKVLSAVANLFIHLNNRYSGDKSLNERVKTMVELDFSEEHLTVLIRENKAIEIARKAIKKGLSLDDIADLTGLNLDTIEELKEHLEQEAEENGE